MKHLLLVASGGFIGTGLRYAISKSIMQYAINIKFPISTFIVNILGCLIAGVLSGFIIKHGYFTTNVRLFLLTGILGGLTTFSAFIMDVFYLLKKEDFIQAISYSSLTFFIGYMAMFLGFYIIFKWA